MTTFLRSRQRGMGIVEVMVGILIGMIVVVAIYNVFAVAEGYKRTTVGAADAQTTGLFAQFVLAREISNSGNALSGDGGELSSCTVVDPKWPVPNPAFGAAGAKPIRPIPVLIRDGGAATTSDALVVTYSTAPRVVSPVLFVDAPMAAPGDPFYIQSPNGFRVNDWIIAYDNTSSCELVRVTSVTPGDSKGDVTTGVVKLGYTPNTAALYKPGSASEGSKVVNLGQASPPAPAGAPLAVRTLFDVANGQLRTTDLFAAAPANPIAQNVVLLKAQYGVDCLGNGVVLWTTATASNICGDGRNYGPDDFMPPTLWDAVDLARIRAIRIGIVVRSDEPDLKDPALVGQTAVLFDCSTHNAACQGRTVLNNAILSDGFRHRFYETIVPMRNAIYNNGT